MSILVTGATGFAGSWLIEALINQTDSVHGLSRRGTWPASCSHLATHAKLHVCDLSDNSSVLAILRETEPQEIYHLAGYPYAGRSFKEPDEAWKGNLHASMSLFNAVVVWGLNPRILSVSSGMIYGDPSEPDQVVTEDCPFQPCNPYGTSKAAVDLLSYEYTRSHGLDIVRARPFNHIGPRQSPEFALASFSRQLAEISMGRRDPVLEVGDLSAYRDMTDVRDVVRAYIDLMKHGKTGEAYNVATGRSCSIQSLLDELIVISGAEVEIRQRADLLRATDMPRITVSVDKLKQATGWEPSHTLTETLQGTLDFWRNAT